MIYKLGRQFILSALLINGRLPRLFFKPGLIIISDFGGLCGLCFAVSLVR